jgi:hypothetical protein
MKKLTYTQKRILVCTRLLKNLKKLVGNKDYPWWAIYADINYYEEELERLEVSL